MTQQDGGVSNSDGQNTADLNTNGQGNNDNGGQNTDIQAQFDELKAQFETLKKESAGKDSKIAQMLKEKELNNLNSKTEKEQLEAYKAKVSEFERREAFRTSFKEVGLNPDEFISIIDEKDPTLQATKFANLLKSRADESAKTALEKFKEEELKKLGGKPDIKDGKITDQNPNKSINNAIRGALGYQ